MQGKRSRTVVFILTLAAALAALTTLALAWIPAATVQVPNSFAESRASGLSDREWWMVGRRGGFGTVRYQSVVMIRALEYEARDTGLEVPVWASLPQPPVLGDYSNDHYELVQAHGWPWPALYFRFSGTGRGNARAGELTGGFELSPWGTGAWYDPRALPYLPIWSGLAADLLLWLVVWLAILRGPIWFMRWRRSRRGQCSWCGYDLTGAVGHRCPECGAVRRPGRQVAAEACAVSSAE